MHELDCITMGSGGGQTNKNEQTSLDGVITFFRTIFPAKPSQIENEPGNSPLSRKMEPSGLMC